MPAFHLPAFPGLQQQLQELVKLWRKRHRENSAHRFHAFSLLPSSAMLIMESVFLSSRVYSRGTAGKNEGEGKPPTVNAQVSHTGLLCMKAHKHLFLWFIKAGLGSISSCVWSQSRGGPGSSGTGTGAALLCRLSVPPSSLQKRQLQHHILPNQESQVCTSGGRQAVVSAASLPFSAGIWRTQLGALQEMVPKFTFIRSNSIWCSLTTSKSESQRQIS